MGRTGDSEGAGMGEVGWVPVFVDKNEKNKPQRRGITFFRESVWRFTKRFALQARKFVRKSRELQKKGLFDCVGSVR